MCDREIAAELCRAVKRGCYWDETDMEAALEILDQFATEVRKECGNTVRALVRNNWRDISGQELYDACLGATGESDDKNTGN